MLRDLPRNARITLLLEPGSAAFACILTFYAALYMQGNGLSAGQIGLITSVGAAAGLLNQLWAAPITNRLGRRNTLLLFSIVCWSIPLLLWSVATGFALFLVAAVIFSFSRITSVAWYCVATEDADDDKKARIFGLLFIIASLGGMATAFAGPALERYGLVPSLRFLYVLAFVSMTVMFVVRHLLLTETRAGIELNRAHAGITVPQSFRRHLEVVALTLRNAESRRLILVYVLFNFAAGMGFVQILFINNVLKLTVTEVSAIPPVAAIVSVVLFRYAVPRLRRSNERGTLLVSLLVFTAGLLLMLLVPAGSLSGTLLSAALAAGGAYLFQVCANAAMNSRMGQLHKADGYSAIQALVALAVIPAGYVAGSTFAVSPSLSILTMGLVALAAAVLTMLPPKRQSEQEAGACDSLGTPPIASCT